MVIESTESGIGAENVKYDIEDSDAGNTTPIDDLTKSLNVEVNSNALTAEELEKFMFKMIMHLKKMGDKVS